MNPCLAKTWIFIFLFFCLQIIYNQSVCLVDGCVAERREVYLRCAFRVVAHALTYDGEGDVEVACGAGP